MSPLPRWFEPMRAVLTDDRFSSPDWIFEPKLDGERILTYRDGPSIQMYTRNQLMANDQYPELVEALLKQKSTSYVVDGEVVAFKPGTSIGSFSRLQERMHVVHPSKKLLNDVPVLYFLFDVPFLNGIDMRSKPLLERKKKLYTSFRFGDSIRFLTHLKANGVAYYKEACRLGWEGLIAKRIDSLYRSTRSHDWLKFKCVNEQEMVIGGYSDPEGTREEFGSLLLGYYDGNQLRFAGKVGTGFSSEILRKVANQLKPLETKQSPFVSIAISRRGLHWVKPKLVAQVGFSEWTDDGKLRHPRFLGLRQDKSAKQVVRESPP